MLKIKSIPKGNPSVQLTSEKESALAILSDGKKQIRIGIGKREEITRRKLIILARQIIAQSKANRLKKITISFSDFVFSHLEMREEEIAELLGMNFEMANFQFVKYKTPAPEGWRFVDEIGVIASSSAVKNGFFKGQIIGDEVNRCRILSNTPGGEMTPQILANDALRAARGTDIKVKILGVREMEKLKMGAILGVGKGSVEKPRFIIMERMKGPKDEKPIVLVGKGVTFDTGGLNVKPGDHMNEMHMDMSGGAAVISALVLASKLKINKNIAGLIPAVENMPSGSSYHPGDILKTMSGKTIEVLNTDAEGRIILADALSYALKYKPRLVVDIATLTGAAMAALGQRASAIFASDENLLKLFQELGEESGDYVWPLPLWEEYEEEVRGTFGDWANIGKTRYGGAITGAIFLHQFIKSEKDKKKTPWVHIDIAPRMTSIEGDHLAKGAAGEPVRLLTKLLERF